MGFLGTTLLQSKTQHDPNLGGAHGADIYPGVMNPTSSNNPSNPAKNNFMDDPTSNEAGAGAGANFRGGKDAKATMRQAAGVVEARPGIIEKAHIAPLDDEANIAANLE